MPITKEELLKGRDKKFAQDYTQEISDNLDKLLIVMNEIRNVYGKPMIVTSAWRPPEINNITLGAAAHSKHIQGLACDIADPDGKLMRWVLENLQLMKDLDVYLEDFRWTSSWVHFQIGAPHSGHRIFIPNSNPASSPDRWDGVYSVEYDE